MFAGGGKPDLAKMESDKPSRSPSGLYNEQSQSSESSKAKSRFNRLGGRKKWVLLATGSTPILAILGFGIAALIMLITQFQLGAVGRVLQDINFVFTKRMTRVLTKRAIYAATNPASKYKISEKALSKLGLRNPLNPIVNFEGTASIRTGRPERVRIGESVIDLDNSLDINTPLGRQKRLSIFSQFDEALSDIPEIDRLGPLAKNRRVTALANSLGYKFSAWDRAKNFWRGIKNEQSLKKAVGEYLEDKIKLVKKAKVKFGSNDLKDLTEWTEEATLSDESIALTESASQGGSETGLRKLARKASGGLAKFARGARGISTIAEIAGYYCLFRDLAKIISDGKLERMYAMAKTGMNILTSVSQAKTGDTSPLAQIMAIKDLGAFQETVAWKAGTFQLSAAQAVAKGFMAMPVGDILWAPVEAIQTIISIVGHKLPIGDSVVDGICNALTSGPGIVLALALEGALIAFTGGGSQGGEKALAKALGKVAEDGAEKAASAAAKGTVKKIVEKSVAEEVSEEAIKALAKQGLRGFFGKVRRVVNFSKNVGKMAALVGGPILLMKLAASGSGLDVGCIGGNDNCMNIGDQGLNFVANTNMQALGGRPSTPAESAEIRETQYEEVLMASKNMPFLKRALSFENPRSPLSLMVADIRVSPEIITKSLSYVLTRPLSIFSPASDVGLAGAVINTMDTNNVALATSGVADGKHFWFFSKSELEKINNDPSFDTDANAEFVKNNLDRLKDKYGKCYEKDEASSFNDDDDFLNECSSLLKEDEALHYRLYLGDNRFLDQGEDVANATDSAGSTNATPGESGAVIGDTSEVPCASGTTDVGVTDGWNGGSKYLIRICQIPGFLSGGSEDIARGGFVTVSSTVSGSVLSMFNAMVAAGLEPTAASSFRSMAKQTELWNSNPTPGEVARPGFSNHQTGFAIDFDVGCFGISGCPRTSGSAGGKVLFPSDNCAATYSRGDRGYSDNPVWWWLNDNAKSYGYKHYCHEAWHWSPSGN